jgi:hypothetical protein
VHLATTLRKCLNPPRDSIPHRSLETSTPGSLDYPWCRGLLPLKVVKSTLVTNVSANLAILAIPPVKIHLYPAICTESTPSRTATYHRTPTHDFLTSPTTAAVALVTAEKLHPSDQANLACSKPHQPWPPSMLKPGLTFGRFVPPLAKPVAK